MDFPHKQELLSAMYTIEELRNKLIYGKPSFSAVETILQAFNKIHSITKAELETMGETLE